MGRKSQLHQLKELKAEVSRLKGRIASLPPELMSSEEAQERIKYLIGCLDEAENVPAIWHDEAINALKEIVALGPINEDTVKTGHDMTDIVIITFLEANGHHEIARNWRDANDRIGAWGPNAFKKETLISVETVTK